MIKIKSIIAEKYDNYWTGYIILERDHNLNYNNDCSRSRPIKKYLRERFPISRKDIRVTHWRKWSEYYLFEIKFCDEAEEAEFILTCKSLESLEL